MAEVPKTIHDLETPCMLVDLDKVKANCQRMTDKCQQMGVSLRPHMKTHKTIQGGDIMTNGTRRKIVVSTVKEAEFYAENGYDDIIYAHPFVKEKLTRRIIQLANKLEMFHLITSNEGAIKALNSTPLENNKHWSLLIDLDCGYHRTGCDWSSDKVVQLAQRTSEAENVDFQGIYVHCGNSYTSDKEEREKIQTITNERIIDVKKRLEAAGIECKHYGTGSTPSCSLPIDEMRLLTEFHPGNYIFYDYMQMLVGSCTIDDIATKIVTTVIDHQPEAQAMMVDCGWTAVSSEGQLPRFAAQSGMALVEGHPNLRLISMTQELGKIQAVEGELDYSKYPLGTRLFLFPYHSCGSSAMHSVYYVHQGDNIVDTWQPTRGW